MHDPLDYLRLPAGAHLFLEGGQGDCAYLIRRGEVEVFIKRAGETSILARRGPGEIIGEMALIDSGTRSASARTISDCEFVVITAQQIRHRISQTDPILRMCLGVVIERYRQTLGLYATGAAPKTLPSVERVPEHDFEAAIKVLTLERELDHAIHNGEFELHFQPIVHLATQDLVGFEALIRWNHPVLGIMQPMDFIPVAEASGLIIGITQWCLREVARVFPRLSAEARRRSRSPGSAPRIALFITVNVSSQDLLDPVFDQVVKLILEDGGVSPEDLKLEITESVLMKDPDGAGRVLAACRRHGMGIAVDDFGTGYSNLSYLSTLPITTLKIDRAFVRSITDGGSSRKIVNTIHHLAGELGIPVVAEGIETAAQAAALVDIGCEFGQGYLFGRPVPFASTLALIANWPVGPADETAPPCILEALCV